MKRNLKDLFIWLVFVFLYFPILILVIYSFNESKMNIIFSGFTFKWYFELFNNVNLINAFINIYI